MLVDLRAEKEVQIVSADGRPQPRTNTVDWTDLIDLSEFGKPQAQIT